MQLCPTRLIPVTQRREMDHLAWPDMCLSTTPNRSNRILSKQKRSFWRYIDLSCDSKISLPMPYGFQSLMSARQWDVQKVSESGDWKYITYPQWEWNSASAPLVTLCIEIAKMNWNFHSYFIDLIRSTGKRSMFPALLLNANPKGHFVNLLNCSGLTSNCSDRIVPPLY